MALNPILNGIRRLSSMPRHPPLFTGAIMIVKFSSTSIIQITTKGLTMNKAEPIDSISEKTGHTQADTIKTLDALLETIEATLPRATRCNYWLGLESSSRSTGRQGQGVIPRPANPLRSPRRHSKNSPPASHPRNGGWRGSVALISSERGPATLAGY